MNELFLNLETSENLYHCSREKLSPTIHIPIIRKMSSSDADDVDAVNGEADAAPAVSAPAKRGRGRPKKVENRGAHLRKENRGKRAAKDSSVKNGTSGTDEVDSDAPAPPKRGRGRPRKDVGTDAAAEAVDVAPRKRGRPKKVEKRGRPRKNGHAETAQTDLQPLLLKNIFCFSNLKLAKLRPRVV